MSTYALFKSAHFGISLPGDNIVSAVERGMSTIARELDLGNAAGYELQAIRADNGNLGGDVRGVLVTIVAKGMPLANGSAIGPAKTYVARLTGPSLAAPVEWALDSHGKLTARAEVE